MADVMLERAKKLHKSAKDLYAQGDLYGVAGLAYQAFECALIALNRKTGGKELTVHKQKLERAKEKIVSFADKLDFLWEARNVDFYGNATPASGQKELTKEEIGECLEVVGKIIAEIEKMLADTGKERD